MGVGEGCWGEWVAKQVSLLHNNNYIIAIVLAIE